MQTNKMNKTLLAGLSIFLLAIIGGNGIARQLRLAPCKEIVRNVRSKRLEIEWKEVSNG